jgi:signal peptidase I
VTTPPAPPAPVTPPVEPEGFKGWALEWTKSIGFAIAVYLVLRIFLFQAFRIPSESMEKTLLKGDWLFVNKAIYGATVPITGWKTPAIRDPAHGDVVVFISVETPDLDVVKRVIGLPGDTIQMRQDTIFRNGAVLVEPNAVYDDTVPMDGPEFRKKIRDWQIGHLARDTAGYWPDRKNWGPIIVPHDSMFVMGDNRDHSWDGRFWGFLPRANVRGTPLFIYYSYDPDTYKPLPAITNIRWGRIFHVPR